MIARVDEPETVLARHGVGSRETLGVQLECCYSQNIVFFTVVHSVQQLFRGVTKYTGISREATLAVIYRSGLHELCNIDLQARLVQAADRNLHSKLRVLLRWSAQCETTTQTPRKMNNRTTVKSEFIHKVFSRN